MRRALSACLTLAMCVAVVVLPAGAAHAIDPPTVRITPGTSSVVLGNTRALTATVTNLDNTAVNWTMRSGPGTGSVSAAGLYTPPAQTPPTPRAVVRASSVEDSGVYGEATITIASGVPAGGFGTGVAVPEGSFDTETGDINGDGIADIVRLQNLANTLQVFRLRTMISDGAGGFTTAISPVASLNPPVGPQVNDFIGDVALGDVDEDGDLDAMVAAEWFDSTGLPPRYVLYRNNGAGAFTPDPVSRAGSSEGRSGARLKLTDFDGDGHLDAVRLDRFGTVVLQRGDGTGAFGAGTTLFSTFAGKYLAVGDLTGDGRPDVAVGTQTAALTPIMQSFDVAINNGFGAIASSTTYGAGVDPDVMISDTSGDGWNDLVVTSGHESSPYPQKVSAFTNLATGTGALTTTPVDLLPFRTYNLSAAHVDGDGLLDLVGSTAYGVFLARRTGANAFTTRHASSTPPNQMAVGDVTGDGRVDVLATTDGFTTFWPGSADTTFAFAVDPTVTRVNATHSVPFTATVRNAPVPVNLQWSATRGTWGTFFDSNVYTAPSTAAPTGSSVRIDASLTGTSEVASRTISVVNEKFQFTSLGSQDVRQIVADPVQSNVLYAATASGVYRSTTGGALFNQLGTTGPTGTNAQRIAVVRDGSTAMLVATFGSGAFRFDLNGPAGTDWVDSEGAFFTASGPVLAVPGTQIVRAVGGGQVWQSPDAGATWTALGGTSVTDIAPIDANSFWAVRSAAPRVMTAVVDGVPSATYTARELPSVDAAVTAITADPTTSGRAYVATLDGQMFRGSAASGSWTSVPVPAVVDRIAVSPTTGAVLAGRSTASDVYKSVDSGASWYSVWRGFPAGFSTFPKSLGHRADGLELVGTNGGLYTPVSATPPAAPIVTDGPSGTSGPGTTGSFVFTFTPTPGAAAHLCALDNSGWTSCTTSKTYSGPLSSGEHTFSVVAIDSNGSESSPGTRTWTVDATPPPVPTIDGGPSGTENDRDVAFTFSLTGDATGAKCTMDSGTETTCVSGVSYTGLSDGSHTFSVRSVDANGNLSAAATRAWTIDATPPAYPNFYNTPGYVTTSTAAQFGWNVDGSATYACSLDDVAVPCATGFHDSVVTEGQHTFTVVATDAAGNSTFPNGFTWIVDTTPPAAPAITDKPPTATGDTSATFEFTSTSPDVQYYICDLDGTDTRFCYASQDYSGLAAGEHTFTVYAVDGANQQSPDTSYTWTVTTDPPPNSPSITGGPTGLVKSRTATFTFTVGDGETATCSLDGAPPVTCVSGVTYTNMPDGNHTFDVYAVSGVGLPSTATSRSWSVDATPPAATTLLDAPPVRTKSTTAAFDWTPGSGLTYTCSLDNATVTCGADGSYAASGLAAGAHTFVVTASDAAGNATPRTHTWTIDLTGPTVSLTGTPLALTNSTTTNFSFSSAAADLHHFSCTVDGDTANCSAPYQRTGLAAGTHTLSVVAVDDVGNAGSPATWTWTVDTSAPTATIATPAAVLNPGLATSFSEPVAGVTSSTVKLLLTGTTTVVPSAVACRNVSNATVDCTTDAVRSAVLTPTGPLVAGQLYTLQTTTGITDLAGNGVPAATLPFRASVSEQETSLGAKPGWRKVSWTKAQGKSFTVAHLKGETASYTFTGTGFTWYGVRGPSYGKADIYVDNVRKATAVNFYSSTTSTLAKTISGLSNAKHTLKIVVRGEKGSTRGTGTDIALDAIKVGSSTSVTPAATYTWARTATSAASGGAFVAEDYAGATYTFTFRGRGVSWVTVLARSMGKATVTIDGVNKGTYDNYSSSTRYGYVRTFTGLTDKTHTVTITVLRQRRSGATGYKVAVDRFAVRP